MVQVNREELAWAAGLFDGEGNCRLSKFYKAKYDPSRGYCSVAISMAQSDVRVLERFQKALFGLGKIYGPYKYKAQSKPYYLFMTKNFEEAQAIAAALYSFLSPVKQEQEYFALPPLPKGPRKRQ